MPLTEKPLQKIGYKTPKAAIFKSESQKLHNSFPVKSGSTIYPGQPVAIDADGTISPYTESTQNYLGIAVNSSLHPAYPALPDAPEVTVMVEAFAIIYGIANTSITVGPVMPTTEVDAETGLVKYGPSSDVKNFIAINPGESGDLIQILVK